MLKTLFGCFIPFPHGNVHLMSVSVLGSGVGVTLLFSYIRGLRSFFGLKILNFNIFGGFQKNEYCWGHEDFVDIFGGHHKIGLYLGDISMNFRVFS